MAKCVIVIVLTGVLLMSRVDANTIRSIIEQREDLKTLKDYMRELPILEELGKINDKKYTFFAPSNEAFRRIPRELQSRYRNRPITVIAKNELQNIMSYHTVFYYETREVFETKDMGDKVVKTKAKNAAKLFFRTLGTDYYVNGAKIVESDLQASNGKVHIIDHFLLDVANYHNAYSYVTQDINHSDNKMTFIKFNSMLQRYSQYQSEAIDILNNVERVTLFVPHDEYFQRISRQKFQDLLNNNELLKTVVESHIIKNGVYHENLLRLYSHETINSNLEGSFRPKVFNRNVYVSNNCAQGKITTANITVSNGVVHIIDGMLGYVYTDLMNKLSEETGGLEESVSRFAEHVRIDPGLTELMTLQSGDTVAESEMLTVFAPVDAAMVNVDLTQNPELLVKTVNMHVLQGKFTMADMTNGDVVQTKQPGINAKFNVTDEAIYVNVNYVRGKIIEGDICTKNGIIHKVDHILGTPAATIYDEMERRDDTQDIWGLIKWTGLQTELDSLYRNMTVFAPKDIAWEEMRASDSGNVFFREDHRENMRLLLKRHIVNSTSAPLILDNINRGDRIIQSSHDAWQIEKKGTEKEPEYIIKFGTRDSIRVIESDIRMKNGMLNIIEHVLFTDDPNDSALVGASWVLIPNVILVSLLLLIVRIR